METVITKEGMIRYFGSVANFIEYLTIKIGNLKKDVETLENFPIFCTHVTKLTNNNTSLQVVLYETKRKMITIINTQLQELEHQKSFAENLK